MTNMEPIFTKNDTLSWSRNPENDTLFSSTFSTEKYMSTPPPLGSTKRVGMNRYLIEDCAKDGGEEFFTEMHSVRITNL